VTVFCRGASACFLCKLLRLTAVPVDRKKDWLTNMDIVKLPVASLARPATSSARHAHQPHRVEGAGRAEASASRPRATGASERVVQGELLARERTPYQSTRAFLIGRSMERAQPAERQPTSLYQSRPAIVSYLHHSQPESLPELSRGCSVNLFV
jgi:hypothetical protein